MWHFAVGLYLVILSGGVLRLAAILGLGSGVLILLFGGVIGHWVDITERMKGRMICVGSWGMGREGCMKSDTQWGVGGGRHIG